MCDAPLINNGATKSEDGSVSYSNSSNFISHQQANKITTVNSEGNNNNNNSNFNEQFDISRSSVTTPGSEIELNLQNFTLKQQQQQQDLTSHYTTSNSNIASRVQSLSVNNTNSKMNTSVNSNAPSAIDATNSIRRLSISTASPHKPLNNANEMYYQNMPHNTGSFLAPPAIPSLYVLKIQNVPSDLTARESHILFALMADCSPRSIEVLVDGSEKFIKATLPDLKVAIQTAIILDSKKNLFGPYFPFKPFIQLFDNQNMQQIPFNDPSFSVKTGEFVSNGSSTNRMTFVDPFNTDESKINNPCSGNIWFNNRQSTAASSSTAPSTNNPLSRDNNSFLRQSIIEKQDDYRNNDYNNYRGGRQSSNMNMDIYSPPVSAPPNLPSQMFSNTINRDPSNLGNSSASSVTDSSLSHLKKASLAMSTSSYGTDPRMSISAGSVDGSIVRLQNYIVNSKHLRNLPLIFASIPGITEEDLDALAKVPPPANPADQNPPCNTLYVGNLPPETTEQDMRLLFQVQPGFSRLSFRNKPNNNNSNHGPMCFVEFEQMIYATRALSTLYGSQIPSRTITQLAQTSDGSITNVNKLMGIRLSFSKNPLGVRNNQTTMAHLQQQQQQQVINNNNSFNNNNNNTNIGNGNSNNYSHNGLSMNARRSIASSSNGIPTISALQTGDMHPKSYSSFSSAQGNSDHQNKYNHYR